MKILAFVCKGNSFKSIICEKFAKELTNDLIIVSGGSSPAPSLYSDGVAIMRKKGFNMEGYRPHSIDELPKKVDYLVLMGCENGCPYIESEKTFYFNMDKYPATTFAEKECIVDALYEKTKNLISEILKMERP